MTNTKGTGIYFSRCHRTELNFLVVNSQKTEQTLYKTIQTWSQGDCNVPILGIISSLFFFFNQFFSTSPFFLAFFLIFFIFLTRSISLNFLTRLIGLYFLTRLISLFFSIFFLAFSYFFVIPIKFDRIQQLYNW